MRATVGSLTTDSHVFEQNALFRLRQEYVDLKQRKVPLDEDFDQEAAAYPKLADPGDTHNFHDNWRILEETNVRARDLKNAVSNFTFSFTSGYRCPVKNRAKGFSIESQHIYGTAFDFDVFIYSDEKNTEYLYKLWEILYLSDDRPTRFRLYDQDGEEVDQDLLPTYPLMPSGVTAYTKGHADWR